MTRALGAIACGHPVTAAAAEAVLRDGGNAFDAVIAAQCVACVAEPVLASLAGGGYLLAHPADADPVVYDFFVRTPLTTAATGTIDFYPIQADFGGVTQEFHIGLGALATPGAVRGMFDIHTDLCRVPIERLMQPAIDAARAGVVTNALQGYIFDIVEPIYMATDEARRVYGGDRDALPGEGELLHQPQLAASFEALRAEGAELFYRGEIGERLVDLCRRQRGQLCREDLAEYHVERRTPLSLRYRDADIFTNPPPSTGGILIAFTLRLLDATEPADVAARVANHAAAMRLTNQARIETRAGDLLDGNLLARYRNEIQNRARFNRGTTHISIIDGEGNLAAMSLSNGEGCGHLIPGTGIMLNNMLGEADLAPNGFHRWQPGERLASMMAPTLIESNGRRFALGSGGSNRIRTAVAQVIDNLLAAGMSIDDAVAAPRIHVEGERLSMEGGFDRPTVTALRAAFAEIDQWDGMNLFFGGVHVVGQSGHEFTAVGDRRRGGVGIALT